MGGFDWARWWAFTADAAVAPLSDPATWHARREQRLQALLDAAVRAPYIASRLRGRAVGSSSLEGLPVFRKPELMAHFDECVTDPSLRLEDLRAFTSVPGTVGLPYGDRYAVWGSSGSSGEPGIFVNDERALAVYDAIECTRRACRRPLARAVDPLLAAERVAYVGAIGGHFAGITAFERIRRLNPWLRPRLRAFSVLQPLSALDAALDEFQPTVLFTYPSTALILAGERRSGRLRMRPSEIWTGGETLTCAARRFVSEAFECPVGNEYGASEFLTLATECRLGALHLNADWAIVECVDANGRLVAAGTRGARCRLTNLANHVQPLIRYELDDQVTLSATGCACGSSLPVIDVAGRSDDMIRLESGPSGAALLSPMALTTVLEEQAGLLDFQLVQCSARRLELRSRGDDAASRKSMARGREALAAYLHAQGIAAVQVLARPGRPPVVEVSGKVKRVVSYEGRHGQRSRAACAAEP